MIGLWFRLWLVACPGVFAGGSKMSCLTLKQPSRFQWWEYSRGNGRWKATASVSWWPAGARRVVYLENKKGHVGKLNHTLSQNLSMCSSWSMCNLFHQSISIRILWWEQHLFLGAKLWSRKTERLHVTFEAPSAGPKLHPTVFPAHVFQETCACEWTVCTRIPVAPFRPLDTCLRYGRRWIHADTDSGDGLPESSRKGVIDEHATGALNRTPSDSMLSYAFGALAFPVSIQKQFYTLFHMTSMPLIPI